MRLKNCGADEFINRLKGRKVICFGAGSTLIEADFEVLNIGLLEKNIAFFIDNDSEKVGLNYQYRGCEFKIKSVKVLNSIKNSEYVLLITCASYIEIYQQLKEMQEIDELDCYMYNCICSYPELDIDNFFNIEINKRPYKEYQEILKQLKLKDKHKGERCFIIGNGPSLTTKDLELLNNEITFAANRIFKLFHETEWRPTYYFCIDYLMYGLDHEEINQIDSQLRFVPTERALAAGKIYDEITYYNRIVNCIIVNNSKIVRSKEFEFSEDILRSVFGGQTVLYDAMQFAIYMGFTEIYLLGVDWNYKLEVTESGNIIERNIEKNHFNDSYDEGLENAIAVVAPIFAVNEAFKKAKEICDSKGITVKNATRGGRLEIFDRIKLEDIFK